MEDATLDNLLGRLEPKPNLLAEREEEQEE